MLTELITSDYYILPELTRSDYLILYFMRAHQIRSYDILIIIDQRSSYVALCLLVGDVKPTTLVLVTASLGVEADRQWLHSRQLPLQSPQFLKNLHTTMLCSIACHRIVVLIKNTIKNTIYHRPPIRGYKRGPPGPHTTLQIPKQMENYKHI
jgi:hypothetical protein